MPFYNFLLFAFGLCRLPAGPERSSSWKGVVEVSLAVSLQGCLNFFSFFFFSASLRATGGFPRRLGNGSEGTNWLRKKLEERTLQLQRVDKINSLHAATSLAGLGNTLYRRGPSNVETKKVAAVRYRLSSSVTLERRRRDTSIYLFLCPSSL